MITVLAILLFLIFSLLGGFHFYWLLGGTYGVKKVIPTKSVHATNTLSVPPIATFIVAVTLITFGLMYLQIVALIAIPLPEWVLQFGSWFVPSIFILRAIGEFNYVGFFKKVKETEFAQADSRIFSPLCLGIGIMGMVINLVNAF